MCVCVCVSACMCVYMCACVCVFYTAAIAGATVVLAVVDEVSLCDRLCVRRSSAAIIGRVCLLDNSGSIARKSRCCGGRARSGAAHIARDAQAVPNDSLGVNVAGASRRAVVFRLHIVESGIGRSASEFAKQRALWLYVRHFRCILQFDFPIRANNGGDIDCSSNQ